MLAALVAMAPATPAPSAIHSLHSYPRALCLDGSPAVYYLSRGSNASSFLFFLEGGGWCQTLSECAERAKTNLGSSTSYAPTLDLSTINAPPSQRGGECNGHDAFDRNASANPLFATWNFVYVPYCDGASFAGDNESASLFFRGKAIREAVVADLRATAGLSEATHVVVSGCSAGGAAVYFHADWFADQLPHATTRAMPDSGWFLDGDYKRDNKSHCAPPYSRAARRAFFTTVQRTTRTAHSAWFSSSYCRRHCFVPPSLSDRRCSLLLRRTQTVRACATCLRWPTSRPRSTLLVCSSSVRMPPSSPHPPPPPRVPPRAP
jgi:hypothetical protein